MATRNRKTRYTMTRWTGLEWVHHSTLTMSETYKMLQSLKVRPDTAGAMRSIDEGEPFKVGGYRFVRVTD